MNITKIVGFGDSWMYGDELLDPDMVRLFKKRAHVSMKENTAYREQYCFLGLLGKHFGVKTENHGIPGGSLQSARWTYLEWLDKEPNPEQCLVLHFITEADRQSFYNPYAEIYPENNNRDEFVHSTWVETGVKSITSDWSDMVKQYIVLTNCQHMRKLNYRETVEFFDSQSVKHGFPLLQTHTMPAPDSWTVPSISNPDFNWVTYFRDHPGNQKRELIKSGGHPNENGHVLIKELLLPEIEHAILT